MSQSVVTDFSSMGANEGTSVKETRFRENSNDLVESAEVRRVAAPVLARPHSFAPVFLSPNHDLHFLEEWLTSMFDIQTTTKSRCYPNKTWKL